MAITFVPEKKGGGRDSSLYILLLKLYYSNDV